MTTGLPVTTALPVEVRRSGRRHRSVSARVEAGRIVVSIPASFTAQQEQEWVGRMVDRLERKQAKSSLSDEELLARAQRLNREVFAGRARFSQVQWVTNQNDRWGSCTMPQGRIRLSHRLAGMPAWVVDYVLVHELAHTLIGHHNSFFWELVGRYPHTERARGFLEGVTFADRQPGTGNPTATPDA